MEKTILSTEAVYEGTMEWATNYMMQEWANDAERYEDLEELDDDIINLANMDYSDALYDQQLYIDDELQAFIKRYEERYKTSVNTLVFLGQRSSHYGAMGGARASVGTYGYRVQGFAEGAEEWELNITEEGTLEFVTLDHDGRNYMEMRVMTDAEAEKADSLDIDYREYLEGKKPTRLDKAFKDAFGA